MITCPRCGAENKDDAAACRMCATALDPMAAGAPRPVVPTQQDIPATVLVQSAGGPQPGAAAPAGKVMCPGCQATNDADWAFCQQCGTRLSAPPPQPAAAPQQPAWGAPTVVTPAPPPMPEPPPAQPVWGAPTVVTPAPEFGQPPQPPPAAPMPPTWGAATVVTPMPPQGVPQPPPPPQNWGAATVITPSPDFGVPGANPPPAWGAPTVVTPPAPGAPPAPPDQRYVETVYTPPAPPAQDLNAYPETILTEPAPSAPPAPPASAAPVAAAFEGVPTAQVPRIDEPPPPPIPGVPAGPGGQSTIVMSSSPIAAPPKQAKLLLIMEGGEVGETYGLRPAETAIGRVDGDIKFPHDGYMSSRHARILQRNGRFFLIDNNSRNGTFVKIHQEVELHPGDVILVGKQLFRFETDE